jgi:hypothetical protein
MGSTGHTIPSYDLTRVFGWEKISGYQKDGKDVYLNMISTIFIRF